MKIWSCPIAQNMNGNFEKFCSEHLGQNFSKFYRHILGNASTLYFHFEIYWPLPKGGLVSHKHSLFCSVFFKKQSFFVLCTRGENQLENGMRACHKMLSCHAHVLLRFHYPNCRVFDLLIILKFICLHILQILKVLINHLRFSIGEVKGNNCLHISIFAHVCFILQMIHRWKALILDNTGRGSILKFATPIFLKLIFRTNWAWPASKLSHAQLLNSKAFSWCIVLESVACTNFMPQPHSVFFLFGFPHFIFWMHRLILQSITI